MVNYIRSRKEIDAIIKAFICAMIFQGGFVLFSKYVTKAVVNRAIGSFPHPNTLAMYLDLISPIILSMLLSGALPKKWNKWAILALALSVISILFTKSRGAWVIMAGAFMVVMFMSFMTKPTWRKSKYIVTGMVLGIVFGGIMSPKIIKRFKTAPKESADTRHYFNNAATGMAGDKYFGVGLNSYSWMLRNIEKYYWMVYPDKWEKFEETADFLAADDFRWSRGGESRLGTCHHIYLLMAAEIGYLGMWIFIAFIVRFYLRTLWFFLRTKDWYFKSIALGMVTGLATLHLHGLLEWIFRQTQVFYLFFIISGLFTAIYNLYKLELKVVEKLKDQEKQQGQLNSNETGLKRGKPGFNNINPIPITGMRN